MKVLLVFAHPDDETFNVFGTVKLLSEQGASIKLVLATNGEKGSLGNPPIATRKTLVKIRGQELKKAAKLAGISGFYFFGYKDGFLDQIPRSILKNKILSCLKKERPNIVITFEKNGIFMHPDHKAISQAVTDGFQEYLKIGKHTMRLYHVCLPKSYLKTHLKAGIKYEYFGPMQGTADEEITTRIDITKIYPLKVKAMKCHVTQMKDCKMLFKMSDLIPGKKYEHFKLVGENSTSGPSLDL